MRGISSKKYKLNSVITTRKIEVFCALRKIEGAPGLRRSPWPKNSPLALTVGRKATKPCASGRWTSPAECAAQTKGKKGFPRFWKSDLQIGNPTTKHRGETHQGLGCQPWGNRVPNSTRLHRGRLGHGGRVCIKRRWHLVHRAGNGGGDASR